MDDIHINWLDEINNNNDNDNNNDNNNIFIIKFENLTDIKILEYQNKVIGELRNKFTKETDISKIEWLIEGSKYLSNKMNFPIFYHKENNAFIPRSSYNFCEKGKMCQFNYGKNKKKCYSQHFVYNYLHADLCSLKIYLNCNEYNLEIKKSINTISFVINHMYEELKK